MTFTLTAESPEAIQASQHVNLHITALGHEATNKWVAIRLSDGGSDSRLYETRAEAVRFQLHENQCAYVNIPPTGMTPRGAANYLNFTRFLYERGMRIEDPNRDVLMPMSR